MPSIRVLCVGIVVGVALGMGSVFLLADEPALVLRNGILKGWEVTKDNETLVCKDPMIFIRAKQIECD
jgi:hypothetical protein